MKVTVPVTTYHEVNLSHGQVEEIFKRKLGEVLNWTPGQFCKDKYVYETVEYYTSHSFNIAEKIRPATAADIEHERVYSYVLNQMRGS